MYRLLQSVRDFIPVFRGFAYRVLYYSKQIRIQSGVRFQSRIDIIVREHASLEIRSGAMIRADAELRATGNAKIILEENVVIDRGVRIVATNESTVRICRGAKIGTHSVLNAGDSIFIGEKSLVSGFVYLQTSMHRHAIGKDIQDQGYSHAPVSIGKDSWIGAHATLLPGVTVGDGAIIGSTAVVTKNVESESVVAGVPAKRLKARSAT